MQNKALNNAVTGASLANYQAIFEGFATMGIDAADVVPRENVFTFNAWKALGLVVKKGQHGVKIVTVIPCTKKDQESGDEVAVKKFKTTTVFHVSQTEELGTDPQKDCAVVALDVQADVAQVQPAPPVIEAAPVVEVAVSEKRPMNTYEARQEARRERYEERATKAQGNRNMIYKRARTMAEVIPFGQPILAGHHSEGRDRNYRNKIHNTFGKAFALQNKAAHYARKAASIGSGGISSDDPDAINKLRAELASLEQAQESMKAANKAIRSNKTPETQLAALVVLGFTEARAAQLLEKDFGGRIGFASYSLTNNNANMRRIAGRIADLEKHRQRTGTEQAGNGFVYCEDIEENRVMFVFDSKPDESTRKVLKANGFKWSPSRDGKPWVRQLNNAGIWHGKQVLEELNFARSGNPIRQNEITKIV